MEPTSTNNNNNNTSTARQHSHHRPRVLLGVTGSVAAVKGPEIAVRLAGDLGMDVRVLLTRAGHNFWTKAQEYDPTHWKELQQRMHCSITNSVEQKNTLETNSAESAATEDEREGEIVVHLAEDEWKSWNRLGDPVLHIDLRDWADVAVIAPLSAHTLAKLATGLCDDCLSCVIRAWDFGHGARPGKPLVLAPAMNTAMWEQPLTQSQLTIIRSFWNETRGKSHQNGIHVVEPQIKTLACGEVGTGALAPVHDIIRVVQGLLDEIEVP